MAACSGRQWEDRRDSALISIFIDTGARLSEVTGMRYTPDEPITNDVDLLSGQIRVLGKNNRERLVGISPRTSRSIDRWIRERARRPHAYMPNLWLGKRGKMTSSGIADIVKRRATFAGLGNVHPHILRHTFAHHWLAEGGNETDLMRLAGWQSRTMLQRYGASAGTERAIAAHKRLGLMDRL
jgi:site-specific recombinase XerD